MLMAVADPTFQLSSDFYYRSLLKKVIILIILSILIVRNVAFEFSHPDLPKLPEKSEGDLGEGRPKLHILGSGWLEPAPPRLYWGYRK